MPSSLSGSMFAAPSSGDKRHCYGLEVQEDLSIRPTARDFDKKRRWLERRHPGPQVWHIPNWQQVRFLRNSRYGALLHQVSGQQKQAANHGTTVQASLYPANATTIAFSASKAVDSWQASRTLVERMETQTID